MLSATGVGADRLLTEGEETNYPFLGGCPPDPGVAWGPRPPPSSGQGGPGGAETARQTRVGISISVYFLLKALHQSLG